MTRRVRQWWVWEIATALAVIAVVAAVLISVNQDAPVTPPPTSRSNTPSATAPVSLTLPALAVKIDNVPDARPQAGLGSAEVVYVDRSRAG